MEMDQENDVDLDVKDADCKASHAENSVNLVYLVCAYINNVNE